VIYGHLKTRLKFGQEMSNVCKLGYRNKNDLFFLLNLNRSLGILHYITSLTGKKICLSRQQIQEVPVKT